MGFDFWGTYTEVILHERIAYTMGDGRQAEVTFAQEGDVTRVRILFDAESENSPELQKEGWQAILNNFKICAEA